MSEPKGEPSAAKKVAGDVTGAAKDLGAGTVRGAAQGAAVGGLAGAAAGAAKGLGVAALRSQSTRRLIIWAAALGAIAILVVVVLLVVLVTFSMTGLSTSNSNETFKSIEQSGVEHSAATSARDEALGYHVPWELSLAVEHVTGELDLDALSAALIAEQLGQVDKGLGAGTVYDATRQMRRMGQTADAEAAAEREEALYTTALVGYGLEPDVADEVFTLALRWTLGQQSTCGPYTPPETEEPPTPAPTETPDGSEESDESEDEREPLTCYDGLVVDGDAVHPLGGPEFPVTSRFGPRETDSSGQASTWHKGIDFGAVCGTPIYAMMTGTVTFSGQAGGFGNLVTIQHGDDLSTRYAHMPFVAPDGNNGRAVMSGDTVDVGQHIGFVGTTGASTGCHLHLEVLLSGTAIDPVPVMHHLGIDLGLGIEGVE